MAALLGDSMAASSVASLADSMVVHLASMKVVSSAVASAFSKVDWRVA
jgi:hypothetical protein